MIGWVVYVLGCLICWQIAIARGSDPETDWWSYLLWPLWLVLAVLLFLGWVANAAISYATGGQKVVVQTLDQ